MMLWAYLIAACCTVSRCVIHGRVSVVFMPCRKRPAADLSLYQDLVQHWTKQGVTNTLITLQRHGKLDIAEGASSNRAIRGELANAQQHHAHATTPYGRVVQRLSCPMPEYPNWEIIHPLALLHYLSGLSAAFGDVMEAAVSQYHTLNLVLYMDEVCPGNPHRPEKVELSNVFTGRSLNGPSTFFSGWLRGPRLVSYDHARSRKSNTAWRRS